jgi:RNA polymerase sigma-70 factor (ECF subfamily)
MTDVHISDAMQLRIWLHGAARRDAAAFRHLYDATSARLYGFALRIVGKRELAEEALQDGFIAIWNNAAAYQDHLAAPMTWMTTIVRNKALDVLQRCGGEAEIDADPFDRRIMEALRDPGAAPADLLALSREAQALGVCMAALEGAQRQVVGLAFFHDLSHSEVAQRMALPLGTVKTWIRRSLDKLRACLAKGGHS